MMKCCQLSLLLIVVTLVCSVQQLRATDSLNFCKVHLNSYGLDDANNLHTSWIEVNNVRVFTNVYGVTPTARGVTTLELNPSTCATSNLKSFDTCGDASAAAALVTYINGLKAGTILIGVSSDELQQSLSAAAITALTGLGLNLAGLNYRGKLNFVASIGKPCLTVWNVQPSGGLNIHTHVHVNTASNNLRIQRVCRVEINAYGLDDANNAHTSWIKVNQMHTVETGTFAVQTNGAYVRGISTIVLDPRTCATSDLRTFDTCGDANAATAFASYVNGLVTGTVLLATTSDEPQQNLANAVQALNNLGVDVSKLNYRGKIVFVAEVGRNEKTISAVLPSGGINLERKIYVKVYDGVVRFERVCQLDLNSYGLDDANNAHTSWIKIDGATIFTDVYSPNRAQRGVNTFTLDARTCTPSAVQSFDTCGSAAAGTALTNYVKGLKTGTVLVSVTSDEPQQNLGAAATTLKTSVGIDLSTLNYRGKFLFATQLPYTASTVSQVEKSGGSNIHQLVEIHDTGLESIVVGL